MAVGDSSCTMIDINGKKILGNKILFRVAAYNCIKYAHILVFLH